MRSESATVPAAVMPDRSNDDGFMISCHCPEYLGWEGFIKPGQVRRPARQTHIQGFREERLRVSDDSILILLKSGNIGKSLKEGLE